MASQYEWHSYCSLTWKYDNQCFWDALWLYYSTSVYNYVGSFVQVTNWTLSQVIVQSRVELRNFQEVSRILHLAVIAALDCCLMETLLQQLYFEMSRKLVNQCKCYRWGVFSCMVLPNLDTNSREPWKLLALHFAGGSPLYACQYIRHYRGELLQRIS